MRLKTGVAIFLMFIFAKTALAAGPYNYAELWRSWDIVAREAYISGVVDGIVEAYIVTMTTVASDKLAITQPAEVKKIIDKLSVRYDKLFVRYTRDQLRDVITDFYKDPANSFISSLLKN